MTIKRQYVLPNCSLILEGLSADASNVLSILANAEFKIVGIEQSLSGGTEFFKALNSAVSAYCQRLLSGLDHPEHMGSQTSLVTVEADEGQYHRLIVQPECLNDSSGDETDGKAPKNIKLSTVQLFDMAEAIDQFYADTQTLPDVTVPLAPLPRKYVRPEEPLAKRAVPPVLGLGTLAVAALGLFFLPVPELTEPEGLQQNSAALEEQIENEIAIDTDADGTAPTSEVPEEGAEDGEISEDAETSSQPPLITDTEQLTALQQQVQGQITDGLSSDTTFDQPLRYQISVAANGDIVGYNPVDSASLENLDSTPLPELTYIPVDETSVASVAQFEVAFAPDGTVAVVSDQLSTVESEAVTPDAVNLEVVESESVEDEDLPEESDNETSEQSSVPNSETVTGRSAETAAETLAAITTPIQDVDRIDALNQGLRRTIIQNRVPDRTGPEVRYRIRLDQEGNVTGYEATSAVAERYVDDFNLPSLIKDSSDEQPQLDFLVVISDDNIVEVNPWDGWPEN
ncbi:DUF4335 domain-containing protein [Leptolyngbyaceae cyanobacterium CCMR0082]|uniref:DUF4335 domain-containing protein n=1 Tax=Adonisia turfae CCMR0082 TaxID=2304604 RepID=A0A6M0S820_9CYAN|nr:DUF4335 domain-containing protein [Adonisia turfae]NEZ64530.1 DUF4335 domain-containing protein [Adonisia turfae CCMR0082]